MHDRMAEPLISIALCTYNGTRYLREQLDSLLAQHYRNIEVLAVDDASTDDTLALLKAYAERDPRIRVVANATNLGFKRNFEYAMSLCRGEFIAPCDQDDIWFPEKIAALHAVIGDRPMAYCDSEVINADGQLLAMAMSDMHFMTTTDDLMIFVGGNCVSGHAMLFRRELIERAFPVPESFFYDWWLAAVAATRGGMVYCPKKLVQYRQHGANVTDILGVRGDDRSKRAPGYSWLKLHEFGVRVQCLSTLPDKHQPMMQALSALLSKREQQWLSPALALFMFRYGSRLYVIQQLSRRFLLSHAIKFVWGVKLKRLLNRYAYTPP